MYSSFEILSQSSSCESCESLQSTAISFAKKTCNERAINHQRDKEQMYHVEICKGILLKKNMILIFNLASKQEKRPLHNWKTTFILGHQE
jgi:hypothetical protein